MPRNGDITKFLVPAGGPSSRPPSRRTSSRNSITSRPASDLPSSPRTPQKPEPRPLTLSDEIGASDEDDADDSDDSLESITAMIRGGPKASPVTHQRDVNPLATPQAKRIAYTGVHKSPLTLQPKRHRFDLKSLIKHTRQDERIEESARLADDLINQGDDDGGDRDSDASSIGDKPGQAREAAEKLLLADQEERKADRLVQAVKRTKVSSTRRWCYFFNPGPTSTSLSRQPFPQEKARGCWRCLAKLTTRDQAFIHGLPHVIVANGRALPDEIFSWILDEICAEEDAQLRVQYSNLVALCEDNTRRLVDDKQLYAMLKHLGGPKYSRAHTKFDISPEVGEPSSPRDWTGLVTFLNLLGLIAPNLETPNALSAVQLLLRMSLDPVVATCVYNEYAAALEALVSALAKARSSWNLACEAICSFLCENVDSTTAKSTAISLIPRSTAHLQDLQRRLAEAVLFLESTPCNQPPDALVSFQRIRDRLDSPDFKVSHATGSTKYDELRALVTLLSIVVSDVQCTRHPPPSTTSQYPAGAQGPSPPPSSEAHKQPSSSTAPAHSRVDANSNSNSNSGPAARTHFRRPRRTEELAAYPATDRAFDAELDRLVARLRALHGLILDSNSDARKDVKADLDALAKRLTTTVRTRPPPQVDIYGLQAARERERESTRESEGQRAFMSGWVQQGG